MNSSCSNTLRIRVGYSKRNPGIGMILATKPRLFIQNSTGKKILENEIRY